MAPVRHPIGASQGAFLRSDLWQRRRPCAIDLAVVVPDEGRKEIGQVALPRCRIETRWADRCLEPEECAGGLVVCGPTGDRLSAPLLAGVYIEGLPLERCVRLLDLAFR